MAPKDATGTGPKREFGSWDFERWTHRRSLKIGPDIYTAESAPPASIHKTKKQLRGSAAAARINISTLKNTRTALNSASPKLKSGCTHSEAPIKPSDVSTTGDIGHASSPQQDPSAQSNVDRAQRLQCTLLCASTTTESVGSSDIGDWIDVGEGNDLDEFELVD